MRAVPLTPLTALQAGPVDPDDLADALCADDDAVDQWLADPPTRALRRLLHDQLYDLLAALDERRVPGRRWLALARHDARRFTWAVPPEAVLPVEDPAVREGLREVLRAQLGSADGTDGLPWLLHPDAFEDAEARTLLETRLTQGGWAARLPVLDALLDRGMTWAAAGWLRRTLLELDADAGEALALQARAERFCSAQLLVTLAGVRPWDTDSNRLRAAAGGASDDELRLLVLGRPDRFDSAPDAFGWARIVALAELSTRDSSRARSACAQALATEPDSDAARAAAIDAVLAMQRVHGADAVPDLVSAFLAGLHREPAGGVLLRWLRGQPRRALVAALDDLPEWQPRYEPLAMERLTYELAPLLGPSDREAVAELAELAGGARGRLVLDEL